MRLIDSCHFRPKECYGAFGFWRFGVVGNITYLKCHLLRKLNALATNQDLFLLTGFLGLITSSIWLKGFCFDGYIIAFRVCVETLCIFESAFRMIENDFDESF